MTTEEIKSLILKTVNLLNGVVNPRNYVKNVVFTQDPNFKFYGLYNDKNKDITFSPDLIQDTVIEDYKCETIVYIVLHELSHCDQFLDWRMYQYNQCYKEYIEFGATANAVYFMENYKEWLEQKLGIVIKTEPITLMNEMLNENAHKIYMSNLHHEILNTERITFGEKNV